MKVLYELDYSHVHGSNAKLRGWALINGKRKEAFRMFSRYADNSGLDTKREEIRKEILGDIA